MDEMLGKKLDETKKEIDGLAKEVAEREARLKELHAQGDAIDVELDKLTDEHNELYIKFLRSQTDLIFACSPFANSDIALAATRDHHLLIDQIEANNKARVAKNDERNKIVDEINKLTPPKSSIWDSLSWLGAGGMAYAAAKMVTEAAKTEPAPPPGEGGAASGGSSEAPTTEPGGGAVEPSGG